MNRVIYFALFFLFVLFSISYAESYKVAFETKTCDGNNGFVSLSIESIYKIQEGDCIDPDNPSQKLKQLLVHNGSGSYNIHSLGQDEAQDVMDEVKAYLKARRNAIERANTVIVTD